VEEGLDLVGHWKEVTSHMGFQYSATD